MKTTFGTRRKRDGCGGNYRTTMSARFSGAFVKAIYKKLSRQISMFRRYAYRTSSSAKSGAGFTQRD